MDRRSKASIVESLAGISIIQHGKYITGYILSVLGIGI